MNIVGIVKFNDRNICVYNDVNEPYFKVKDIASMLGTLYDEEYLIGLCEHDEYEINNTNDVETYFVNEHGMYNILSQTKEVTARKWRRVIFNQLIELRKSRNMNIIEQFDEWDHALNNIYWDDEKKMLMESVTIPGGDVVQIPFENQ